MAKKGNFKLLSPKMDIVFQVLFGEPGSEDITKSFLEAILDRKIENVDLSKNPVLRRLSLDDKMGILDVLVKFNANEYCNIEMQVRKEKDLTERALFYWSRTYSRGLNKGQLYEELPKTVVVLIIDFVLEELKDLGFHTKWKIMEVEKGKKILTDSLEIDIIELPKIHKNKDQNKEKLLEWLYFLENPKSKKVGMIMEKNKEIKRAEQKLEEISQDEIMQKLSDWRESAERRELYRQREIEEIRKGKKEIKEGKKEIEEGKKEIKEGKKEIEEGKKEIEEGKKEIEEGKKEIEEGKKEIEEGKKEIEEGKKEIEEGKKEIKDGKKEIEKDRKEIKEEREELEKEKINLAKNLLKNNINIKEIEKITGLSKEEIES